MACSVPHPVYVDLRAAEQNLLLSAGWKPVVQRTDVLSHVAQGFREDDDDDH